MSRAASTPGVLLLLCGLTLSACGLLGKEAARPASPRTTAVPAAIHRVTQLDFASAARYAHCVEPACPAVTPKTLAATREPAARPVAAAPIALPASAALDAPGSRPTSAPTETPRTLVLHFRTNSAALTAAHQALLRNALADLRGTDRIVIAGRTDDLGSVALNQSLAFARALAIRDHLLDLAPDLPARLAIDAKGRCCYAVANDTDAARAENRRVEITFTPHTGAAR